MGKPKKGKKAKAQSNAKPAAKARAGVAAHAAKARPAAKAKPGKGAKPNAKAASHKSAAHKAAPTAKQPTGAGALAELQARWPGLSDNEIEAFGSLVSNAQADGLGMKTKAEDVLREATRWALVIDEALRSYGDGALKAYSPRRFAYLLHTATKLEAVLGRTQGKRPSTEGSRTHAEDTRKEAMTARAEAVERLSTYAGLRAAERTQIEDAMLTDTDTSADLLVRSLRKLAFLEIDWLERNDPTSKVLAENAGLAYANAEALRAYADMLSAKKVAAILSGRTDDQDTPTVNRIEGRVLFELREAKRVFDGAHAKNAVVPQLSYASSIRHAFERKHPTLHPAPKPEANGASDAVS
jgi:hypothetical protein